MVFWRSTPNFYFLSVVLCQLCTGNCSHFCTSFVLSKLQAELGAGDAVHLVVMKPRFNLQHSTRWVERGTPVSSVLRRRRQERSGRSSLATKQVQSQSGPASPCQKRRGGGKEGGRGGGGEK